MTETNEPKPIGPRPYRNGTHHRVSFTLVEILAVTILLAVLIGTTVVGLPDIAHRERLESALANIGQFDSVARTQALANGRPRMLVFPEGRAVVEIAEPVTEGDELRWEVAARLRYDDHVSLIDVIDRSEAINAPSTATKADANANAETHHRILIRGDGQSATYAVVCEAAEGVRAGILVDGRTGICRIVDLEPNGEIDPNLLNTGELLCE